MNIAQQKAELKDAIEAGKYARWMARNVFAAPNRMERLHCQNVHDSIFWANHEKAGFMDGYQS